jgi:hypothetical protein
MVLLIFYIDSVSLYESSNDPNKLNVLYFSILVGSINLYNFKHISNKANASLYLYNINAISPKF